MVSNKFIQGYIEEAVRGDVTLRDNSIHVYIDKYIWLERLYDGRFDKWHKDIPSFGSGKIVRYTIPFEFLV